MVKTTSYLRLNGLKVIKPVCNAFDYPEKDDMFDLHKCIENMPDFHIPKLIKLCGKQDNV